MNFTGNELESNDILDFSDNCENFDVLLNADQDYWTTRLGEKKPTVDYALRMAGFTPAGFDFATGGVLKNGDRNKCVFNQADQTWHSWSGDLPYNVIGGSVPGEGWKVVERNALTIAREALRRTYQEAGYNLVEGSFEEGANITSTTDVVLHEKTGKCYSGPVGNVPKGTDPLSGSFVDKSGEITVHVNTYFGIDSYRGPAFTINCGGRFNVFDKAHGIFDRDPSDTTSPADGGIVRIDALGRRWKRRYVGQVYTSWWGTDGDALLAAVATGKNVWINNGTYDVLGGRLYARVGQSIVGESLDKTIVRLVSNAGVGRKTVIEMDDYSFIDNFTVDGNYQNNIADMSSWGAHTDSPFAHGIYTSRLQTNAGVFKAATRPRVGRVISKNTIRSCLVVTGNNPIVDDVKLMESAVDHHVYFSGSTSARCGTIECSGATTSESVAFATPPDVSDDDIKIETLKLSNIQSSVFYVQNGSSQYRPGYLNFRHWTGNSILSAEITTLVIDDQSAAFSSKTFLVGNRWVVKCGTVTIKTMDAVNKIAVDVNNSRVSMGSLHLWLRGTGGSTDTDKTTVIRVSTEDNAYNTSLNIGKCILNVFDNLSQYMVAVLNSGSTINIDDLNYIGRKGLVHRIAGDLFDAKTVVGVKRIDGGFDKFMTATKSPTTTAWYSDATGDMKVVSAGVSPTIAGARFLKLSYAAPTNITSFVGDCDNQTFTVIGDGVVTLQNTSALKTTTGDNILTEVGRPYQFMWSGGISYQY